MQQLSPDPVAVLLFMIEGLIPYDCKQAHDAAIRACGGPAKSLAASTALVDLAFQLEALALAADTQQPSVVVDAHKNDAVAALYAALVA